MHPRTGSTALAATLAAALLLAAPAQGQGIMAPRDSSHRFSLFGGTAAADSRGPETGFEIGASGDFHWRPVPVPLRLSLSFSQHNDGYQFEPSKGGKASLEAVLRPFARHLGMRPYFLAGVGAATHAPFSGYFPRLDVAPDGGFMTQYVAYARPRQSWAFASVGAGLDIGRAFVQVKFENPVASQGPVVVPLNIGFRFWD